MKSLNQIIAELESFATAHYQIHTFGHGDVWEISPESNSIVYPLLWMVPQSATPSLREVTQTFTVLCMDLVDSGEKNETEVLSDTQQIILDVCAYYRQTHTNSYIIEFGGSIQPFTEAHPERVSGNSISITIRQPFDFNLCAVPANSVPVPPVPGCSPATWILENMGGTQLSTGTIDSGLSDTIVAPDATWKLFQELSASQIGSGSIASGGIANIIAPYATVLRDGVAYGFVDSDATIDVPSDCPYPPSWEPNPDWPDFPSTLIPTDETFYGVYVLFKDGYNRLALTVTSGVTVDTGDGNSFIATGGVDEYIYDYATVAETEYTDAASGLLVKYVMVTMTGTISSLSLCPTTTVANLKALNWADIYASIPNCGTISIGNTEAYFEMRLLERIRIIAKASGSAISLLANLRSLSIVEFPWSTVTASNSIFLNTGAVDYIPSIDWSAITLTNSAASGTLIRHIGEITLNSNGVNIFNNSYIERIDRVITNATTLQGFLTGTKNMRAEVRFTAPNVTNIIFILGGGIGSGCPKLTIDDASSVTTTTNAFVNCNVSAGVILNGITVGFSVADTAITVQGMSDTAAALGTASGAQTITVTDTPFGAALTALDATAVAVAAVITGKGYTIAN